MEKRYVIRNIATQEFYIGVPGVFEKYLEDAGLFKSRESLEENIKYAFKGEEVCFLEVIEIYCKYKEQDIEEYIEQYKKDEPEVWKEQ